MTALFSELKSNISNIDLDKNKKKLFLCFDNSQKKQFFLYIVKSMKI